MARKKVHPNIAYDDVKGTYYVTLYYGLDENGKPKKSSKTAKTISEAKRILKEHESQRTTGTSCAPSSLTLSSYIDTYLDFKSGSLQPTTIYGYQNIAKHIRAFFRKKKIQEIDTVALRKYVNYVQSLGLSNSSINKHIAFLKSVFSSAKRDGIITKNPAEFIDNLKVQDAERTCYDAQQINQLCLSVQGTSLEIPVLLGAYLGMRRGEILGLTWDHVDLDAKQLTIATTLTKAGSQRIEKEPKTKKSYRSLAIPDLLCAKLAAQKDRLETLLRNNCQLERHNYVVFLKNGHPFSPNYLSDKFHKHLKKLGFPPIRFHDLRHSFASISYAAGVPLSETSSALGHASTAVTAAVYTHEFTPVKATAVNAVYQALCDAASADSCA